jgi:hypothetical protein
MDEAILDVVELVDVIHNCLTLILHKMLDKGISADGNSEANVAVNHKGPRREQRTEVIKGGIGSEHAQGGSVGVGRRDTLDEKLGHGLLCAVEGDNIETVCGELRNMFEYFRAMRTTKSHLRYVDYLGNVLDAWGKTGGQQGDALEMIVFCLSAHHLWGRTLAKYNQDACAVAYADDDNIKAKLSVALEVLSDLKHARRWPLRARTGSHRWPCLPGRQGLAGGIIR